MVKISSLRSNILIILFSLFVILIFSKCTKKESILDTGANQDEYMLKSSGSPILTFDELISSDGGELIDIPSGYQFAQNWEYQNAYLFKTNGGDTHEIYTFVENSSELNDAKAACDKIYTKTEVNGKTVINCENVGNGCTVTVTEECGVCITVCVVE